MTLNYLLLVFSIKMLNVKVLRLLVIGDLLFNPIIFILYQLFIFILLNQYVWDNVDSILYASDVYIGYLAVFGELIFQILTLRKLSKI
jgi:hypothetical protein